MYIVRVSIFQSILSQSGLSLKVTRYLSLNLYSVKISTAKQLQTCRNIYTCSVLVLKTVSVINLKICLAKLYSRQLVVVGGGGAFKRGADTKIEFGGEFLPGFPW